ncbi:MAG: hypothetical protein U0Y68_08115 [Blastocatellia bacterium]
MANPHNLQPGQKLWYVPNWKQSAPRELTIEKIGRKWATTAYERVDLETLRVDGGQYGSPGQCYLSREAYETHQVTMRTWMNFCQRLTPTRTRATLEQIQQAAALLGISLEDKPHE